MTKEEKKTLVRLEHMPRMYDARKHFEALKLLKSAVDGESSVWQDSQASQTAKMNGMMTVPAIVDGEACWRRVNLNPRLPSLFWKLLLQNPIRIQSESNPNPVVFLS